MNVRKLNEECEVCNGPTFKVALFELQIAYLNVCPKCELFWTEEKGQARTWSIASREVWFQVIAKEALDEVKKYEIQVQ